MRLGMGATSVPIPTAGPVIGMATALLAQSPQLVSDLAVLLKDDEEEPVVKCRALEILTRLKEAAAPAATDVAGLLEDGEEEKEVARTSPRGYTKLVFVAPHL